MFVHTQHSICYGVKSPETAIDWGKKQLFPFLIIADINSTSAILSSAKYAQENNYKIIAGVDIRNKNDICYHIVARNNRGFHELNTFLSNHLQKEHSFPSSAPYLPNCYIIYPLKKAPKALKNNEFIGIQQTEFSQLDFQQSLPLNKFILFYKMTYETQREFNTHRLLRAIDNNCLLSQLPKKEEANKNDKYVTFVQFETISKKMPFLLQQTLDLFSDCCLHFDFGDKVQAKNLVSYTDSKEEDRILIKTLCEQGKKKRYPKEQFQDLTDKIDRRIQHELQTIDQKDYLAYFLITWDIVHYAKSQGYFHVGRGSGANSIIAYLLGITDVDPLELDLYFERFINLHRKSPPDFDIDFSWKERDDVMNYIFQRFSNVALLCTYNTFQYRACIRELGKVFGLPKEEIEHLIYNDYTLSELDSTQRLIIKYSKCIEGLPSHLGVHPGGIIISEKPISWYGVTFFPPKGFLTTQFSMLEAEDIGFYKFDILSQRGLSKIRDSLDVINYNQPKAKVHDLHDMVFLKKDEKIKKLLQNGDAMGCFYVESPAMRMLMQKLKTSNYLELVAASSIIRPGVASSGMMQEYILRHKNPERRKAAHPLLLELMPETYGIMVYQEDVIKVAHHFAGLTLDEADVLRRGMSGKFRSRGHFTDIKEQFFTNCKEKGHLLSTTQQIWDQIESFAGYAFSKGHSASYAVESFQSLYLKAYFPLEYMVATINNFGGYYSSEFYIHEAQRKGAKIEAPCIQNSEWETIIKGKTIYLGFQHLLNCNQKEILRILQFRQEVGTIHSLHQLLVALYPTLENILLLIRINAFRSISSDKHALKWEVHLFYRKSKLKKEQFELFPSTPQEFTLPALDKNELEQTYEEVELLGFPLCNPFKLLESLPKQQIPAASLHQYSGKTITLYGYLVTVKTSKTKQGLKMKFGTFHDFWGIYFDTVHFPTSAKHYPFRGKGIYILKGKVSVEFDYYVLEVFYQKKLNHSSDARYM